MAHQAAVAFVGAGNMAEAIARGVLRSALYRPDDLRAADPSPQRRALFSSDLQVNCVESSAAAVTGAAVVVLAVKPQMMADALAQIKDALGADTLVISIAAGITTTYLESQLKPGTRVVRVMPNTPMLVGEGVSGLCKGSHATDDDIMLAERIFTSGGKTIRVNEDMMNAVTAVSGSGPAYVFYLTEAMAAAAVALGLGEAEAMMLARQTVIGAARLMEQSKDAAGELRRKVTSPGGTTQAAVESLEASDFIGVMTRAIHAADSRGKELAK